MVFWKIAYRNVKKNWRHSLSALLSLSASFVSLVLFDGYIDNLTQMYEDSFRHRSMLGDLIIEKPEIHTKSGLAEPWKYSLFEHEQVDLENFLKEQKELVNNRVRFLNFQGLITNGNQSAIVLGRGFDVISGEKVRGQNWSWNATLGLPLHKSNIEFSAMLGQGLAKKLGCTWDFSHRIHSYTGGYEAKERSFDCPSKDLQISVMTSDTQLNAVNVSAVGLMDAGYRDIDDRYLITSLETAQTLLNSKNVTMMAVELKNPNEKNKFIEFFNQKFATQYPQIKIMTWLEHPIGGTYIKILDLMSIFRNFVVLVILIISTLSVVNTLIKIIKERSREIGTIRSLGFKTKQVVKMFMYETFLLTLCGNFIGIVASLLLTLILNSIQIRYKAGLLSESVLFKINFTFYGYLNAFSILVFVSFLACLYSTRHELNKKIIENLDHV
ncbi:MAG: FtsX-like permease family protein [Bdellovibrionota bacterium]